MTEFEALRDKLGEAMSAEMDAMTASGPVLLAEAKPRLVAAMSRTVSKHFADQLVVERDPSDPNKLNIFVPEGAARYFFGIEVEGVGGPGDAS